MYDAFHYDKPRLQKKVPRTQLTTVLSLLLSHLRILMFIGSLRRRVSQQLIISSSSTSARSSYARVAVPQFLAPLLSQRLLFQKLDLNCSLLSGQITLNKLLSNAEDFLHRPKKERRVCHVELSRAHRENFTDDQPALKTAFGPSW